MQNAELGAANCNLTKMFAAAITERSPQKGKTMTTSKWLKNNTSSLSGKTVAVTGTTGGIGRELCFYLAALGADLILLDRNRQKSEAFRTELLERFPSVSVVCITLELESLASAREASDALNARGVDVFIHNAGAYSIPRRISSYGYDNVFTINFLAPYYIIKEILPTLRARHGRAVAVGSIAHRYSRTDRSDVDFSTRKQASLVYGNAKRHLMYGLFELFTDEREASLAVAHPGITFTNITAHYPKLIFALIKHPMKVIFMKPRRAALSILAGIFEDAGYCEWIGPRCFDIWGLPKKKKLRSADESERAYIGQISEKLYREAAEKSLDD